MKFRYQPAGDQSILVEVSRQDDEETNAKIRSLSKLVEEEQVSGFGETILGYRTLLVTYDPLQLTFAEAVRKLKSLEREMKEVELPKTRVIEIPIVYGGENGPDLEAVAEHNQLTPQEVITIHSSPEYLVYFLGFTPGFPFLGGMSEKLATPRLSNPRVSIPGGSVGIAEGQTGIYPVKSPGGWRLIGRTPLALYDPGKANPFLLEAGDYVKFKPIRQREFESIVHEVETGEYEPVISVKGGNGHF
ncbi:MAG TPA: 5-oxoprolinase subunit PxpB [Bacillales bacterium]|nr:5-oxoprolinase subunit PxpB [Bacillales bacterium]